MRRIFCVVLFTALGMLAATPAFADDYSKTVSINVSMLGQSVVGTAVGTYSADPNAAKPVKISVNWTCNCTVNDTPATITGTWEGTWNGKDYEGKITSVTGWPSVPIKAFTFLGKSLSVGGTVPSPAGRQFDVRSGSAYVTSDFRTFGQVSIPLNVQASGYNSAKDPLPSPFTAVNNFQATNLAGVQMISGLPRTGEAPPIFNILALSALVAGAIALVASRRLSRSAA